MAAAGGVITTGNHPKLLWPGVHAVWGQIYNQYPTEYTDLYDVEDTDRAYEEDVQVTGYGLAPVKPEGQAGTFTSEVQGIVSRYVPIAYALGYIVTYEELADNQYDVVAPRRAKANAYSMAQTVENVGAFLYNNAFSTTFFTTGDGVALASASHTQATGGTFSNVLTPAADLSEAALEDISIQIMGATMDSGLLINVMPESLHVPRQELYNATRIMQSVQQSGTANNDVNALRALNAFPRGIKLNHYFSAPHAWFVRTNVPNGMRMFWRERPQLARDNDFATKNALALSYMRLAVGCTDPRGLFASNGP
jgi:hypothetical protein